MKRKVNNKKALRRPRRQTLLSLVLVFILSLMTIGFAFYGKILNIEGAINVKSPGTIGITDVSLSASTNVDASKLPTWTAHDIDFNLIFLQNSGTATYLITIENQTFQDYNLQLPDWEPTVFAVQGDQHVAISGGSVNYTISGATSGELLPAGSSKTITLDIVFSTTGYAGWQFEVDGDYQITTIADTTGSVLCSVSPSSIDLSGNNSFATITLSLINSFPYTKNFIPRVVDGSKFSLTEATGDPLIDHSVANNANADYAFRLNRKSGAIFPSNTIQATPIIDVAGQGSVNCGAITVAVTSNASGQDTEAPIISNVTASRADTDGHALVSWNGSDNVGVSHYTIMTYRQNGTLVSTSNTTNADTSFTVSGLSDGTYYFVVYGTDYAGNSATSAEINAATTAPGHASRSSQVNLNWQYSVTFNLTNLSYTGNNTVRHGANYNATLRANSGFYSLPSSITVTMAGATLATNRYSYSSSNGAISITNVTGNLVITATASGGICLVEGTSIRLADGSEKAIEEIGYSDKLRVWDYETGSIGAEYPAWIEKPHSIDRYQRTTFSDGTVLKTVGYHGIFNVDLYKFVSVDNPEEFNVGTTVYKLEGDQLVPVLVTEIETVYEEVSYHHVVSASVYNIIANGLLTTDGTVILSNRYGGFDTPVKWPAIRQLIISNPANLYSYDDFKDFMPYRIFIDLRVAEGKVLEQYLPLEVFRRYLKENVVNYGTWDTTGYLDYPAP